MDLTIRTSTHHNILLVSDAPSGIIYNLPGSNSWSGETENGRIYIEELQTGPFTIRYSFFQFIKKATLYFRRSQPVAGVRIAASKSKWNIALPGEDTVTLKRNHFVLFSPGVKGEKIVFEKGLEYHGIEVLCEPDKLKELMDLFPGIAEFVGDGEINPRAFLLNRPLLAPHTVLDIINGNPDFRSEDLLLKLYKFLMMRVVAQMNEEIPTTEELDAVIRAEKLIMRNIRKHYTIPNIAKKVGLNESRLKYVFKFQFKNSIFQYLLKARMQKAKELLSTTNKPLKEIANLTGYSHLTNFITAFQKVFDYTPRTVKRPI